MAAIDELTPAPKSRFLAGHDWPTIVLSGVAIAAAIVALVLGLTSAQGTGLVPQNALGTVANVILVGTPGPFIAYQGYSNPISVPPTLAVPVTFAAGLAVVAAILPGALGGGGGARRARGRSAKRQHGRHGALTLPTPRATMPGAR